MNNKIKKIGFFKRKKLPLDDNENNLNIIPLHYKMLLPVFFTGTFVFFGKQFELIQLMNKEKIRKYNAIRKELYDFLYLHKTFYKVTRIKIMTEGDVALHTLKLDISNSFEKFLRRSDFVKFDEQIENTLNFLQKVGYGAHIEKEEIFKVLKKTF